MTEENFTQESALIYHITEGPNVTKVSAEDGLEVEAFAVNAKLSYDEGESIIDYELLFVDEDTANGFIAFVNGKMEPTHMAFPEGSFDEYREADEEGK